MIGDASSGLFIVRDRASWASDVLRKEKTVKDKWLQITREFGIFVRVTNIFVIIMIAVADLDQETYVEENPQKYEVVDEETAKKRQRMQQFRSKDKPLLRFRFSICQS